MSDELSKLAILISNLNNFMSELMTISGGSSTPTSKIAMYKATSLQ